MNLDNSIECMQYYKSKNKDHLFLVENVYKTVYFAYFSIFRRKINLSNFSFYFLDFFMYIKKHAIKIVYIIFIYTCRNL